MEPFDDQALGERPHIAVFSSDKVGAFIVTTPLLRGLHEKYSGCQIDFFGGEITRDFEERTAYIAARFSLYGGPTTGFLERLAEFIATRRTEAGDYALAINCDEFAELNLVAVTAVNPRFIAGAALSPDFRRKVRPRNEAFGKLLADDDWNGAEFVARHAGIVSSNYIGEIFCRLAHVETDFFRTEAPTAPPPFEVPDVLFTITATRPAKQWPIAYWLEVAQWCAARGLSTGLLGHRPEVERTLYNAGEDEEWLLARAPVRDLRGKTTLPELAGAFSLARAAVCVDTGSLHVAAAVGCPTIAIFGVDADGDGASPLRLWEPRGPHVHIAQTPTKCRACIENRFKNAACLMPGHPCMADLTPSSVSDALERALRGVPDDRAWWPPVGRVVRPAETAPASA